MVYQWWLFHTEDLTVANSTRVHVRIKEGQYCLRPQTIFTSHQFGLTVDELGFLVGRVALTGVMEDLDEGALLPCRAGGPLVEGVVERQVKLRTVLGKHAHARRT